MLRGLGWLEVFLLAVQIIWVNLVTDTAAAIPLGLEPKFGDELKHPPATPRSASSFPACCFASAFWPG